LQDKYKVKLFTRAKNGGGMKPKMIKGAKFNFPPDNKGRWLMTDDHTIHRKFEPEKDTIGDVRVRFSAISYAGD
jgi:hypothetical protein